MPGQTVIEKIISRHAGKTVSADDLTVIDVDPFVVADQRPGRILDGQVLMTIVNGKVVYER